MICYPHAKINLGLHIQTKLMNGYHSLETYFYPVPLCDMLEVVKNNSDLVLFQSSGLEISGNQNDNLILKAYRLLQQKYKIGGVKIHLHKRIPMGAGLGGGSSDAAYMVLMLNKLFNLNLSFEQKKEITDEIGSDCSFFLQSKPAFAFNTGNDFRESNLNLGGYWLVLVKKNVHINTADAYSNILDYSCKIPLPKIENIQILNWKNQVFNDFENKVFISNPELKEIKDKIYELGAIYASMTGSGSACYGIFRNKIEDLSAFAEDFVFECQL